MLAWLDAPPTKLVAVGDPDELPAPCGRRSRSGSASTVFLTRSLPQLLELGHPAVSKGSGLAFVAERLGLELERIVAFGDGENDRELLGAAGLRLRRRRGRPHASPRSPMRRARGPTTKASPP